MIKLSSLKTAHT